MIIPHNEKPITKLRHYGTSALSNAELVSLVIGSGSKEKNAVELASDILAYNEGDLSSFGQMCVSELSDAIQGVGDSKAASLIAAMEIGRRAAAEKAASCITSVHDIRQAAEIFMADLWGERQEHFVALLLNSKKQIIGKETISIGSLAEAPVHPREVFNIAIRKNAAAIIVAHNHPSGDPTPSGQDFEVTERLVKAGEIIGIKVLDHIIVGNGRYYSFKSEGMI